MLKKIRRYIGLLKTAEEYKRFVRDVEENYGPLGISFSCHNVGMHFEDPVETPDHYQIFTYWVISKLHDKEGLRILDLGGTKIGNLVNSLRHGVTAIVLKRPYIDDLGDVNFVEHDVSHGLPFTSDHFDIFISPGTLHLIGLGRYGDKKDPHALLNFLQELKRVMRKKSKIYLLLPLGKDQLLYGLHFIYSFDTIKSIYNTIDAKIVDYFVDEYIRYGFTSSLTGRTNRRFSKDINTEDFKIGQYKIIYLEMELK